MSIKVEDAKKTQLIVVRDPKGNVLRVITPKGFQVGLDQAGNPGTMVFKGGTALTSRVINLTQSGQAANISANDIAVFVSNTLAAANTTVNAYLPKALELGQTHIIKDFLGNASATMALQINTTDGTLIDGAATATITTAYGATMFVWTGSSWSSLALGATSSGFATTAPTYVTINSEGTLTNSRQLKGTASQIVLTDNGAGGTIVISLPNVGTPGTYANPSSVTTDAQGRITSITAGGGGGGSSSNLWIDGNNRIYTSGSVSIDASARYANQIGTDVFFFASGTIGLPPNNAARKVADFGGDVFSSGSVTAKLGLSGSLTNLSDGTAYLIAGSNVTITSASNGAITIASTGGGSSAVTGTWRDPGNAFVTTGSVSIDAQNLTAAQHGTDVFEFFSGSINKTGMTSVFATSGTANQRGVFGGDLVLSGALIPLRGMWFTLFDIDFTLLANQTFASDAGYTIAGLPWLKKNSANEAVAAAITNGIGLQFFPGSSTDYNGGTRTFPYLWMSLSSSIPANFPIDWGSRLRLYVSFGTDNMTAQYDNNVYGFDTNSTSWGVVIKRGYGTGGSNPSTAYFWEVNAGNHTGFLNSSNAYSLATLRTFCYEFGDSPTMHNVMEYRSGTLAAGTPFTSPSLTTWSPGFYGRLENFAQSQDWAGTSDYGPYGSGYLPSGYVSSLGLFLGMQRAGSGTALTGTYQRIRLDVKL